MSTLRFSQAVDLAVRHAMDEDDGVVVFGEDVPMIRRELLARFGPARVRPTPISESAFLGAAVGASLGGLRPIVEVQLVDFLTVGLSALVNEAAKVDTFSGGRWQAPMVVRATCGGGYGDGGQHEQALWGMLGGIPGLTVVVPSNPADAAGLMLSAIAHDGPVVFLEHKLLSDMWLEWMGGSRRKSVDFDLPASGIEGAVDDPPVLVPIGRATVLREGRDIALISLGVGVHRCLQAAQLLANDGVDAAVMDLRTVAPLDRTAITEMAESTGRVLAVDEDYTAGGLSGEIAVAACAGRPSVRFGRVTTESTIPYARDREEAGLPNVGRILDAVKPLLE